MADHGHAPLLDLVLGGEQSAGRGGYLEHVEVVAGGELGQHRPCARVGDQVVGTRGGRPRCQSGEFVAARLGEVEVVGIGEHRRRGDQFRRSWHRDRAQQQVVEQREDRGVGADAQAERQHGHGRARRVGTEHPQGEAHIAAEAAAAARRRQGFATRGRGRTTAAGPESRRAEPQDDSPRFDPAPPAAARDRLRQISCDGVRRGGADEARQKPGRDLHRFSSSGSMPDHRCISASRDARRAARPAGSTIRRTAWRGPRARRRGRRSARTRSPWPPAARA